MTSTIKVNTIQDSCGSSLVAKCGSTITLGASGKTVAIASGASTSGMGRAGTVDWCTTIYTNSPGTVTGVSGKGYFLNTTAGAITVTLPSSPSAGDIIAVKDYGNTWDQACKAVIIDRNGSLINGGSQNATLAGKGQSVTLIYVDGTKGWQDIHDSNANVTGTPNYVEATGGTVITCGDYKTHIFTSDANFVVASAGSTAGSNKVDYFVVAGGAGGGSEYGSTTASGGGGAGGFRLANSYSTPAPTMSPLASSTGLSVPVATYPITVGAGGAGGNASTNPQTPALSGSPGTNSVFSTITSAGGGGGSGVTPPTSSGLAGGSGGGGKQDNGAGGASPCGSTSGGNGNTPPVSPPQGNNGGHSDAGPLSPGPAGTYFSGGGGGAGAVGRPAGTPSFSPQGCGGAGSYIADTIIGPTAPSYGTPGPVSSVRYFSGGGGGGAVSNMPNNRPRGAGGDGGGGFGGSPPGAPNPGTAGANGTANTGGGAGGSGNQHSSAAPSSVRTGGTGGSGIVILRYKFQN